MRRYTDIRTQLDEDGYVVIEDLFTPHECDEMIESGIEFTKNLPDKKDRVVFSSNNPDNEQHKEDYFMESNDKIRVFFEEGAIGADGELTVDPTIALNKVGHALHYLHPLFRCYTYCARIKNIVKDLQMQEPAVVQSMYIYKNPGIGTAVKPHQDITYLYTEPIPPIGFWIALEDATVQNGCLWIAPGSHKSGVHRRSIRNPDSKNTMIYDSPPSFYPHSSFTAVPVRKGSCIILHGNVVHKSDHNKSDKSRHAYTFHIIEKANNNYSPDNWLQEGENAPFVNMYTTKQVM